MKTLRASTLIFSILHVVSAHAAMDCYDIRAKSQVDSKGKKPSCTFVDHTVGVVSGSAVTIYQCGKIRYKLTSYEDNSCVVSTK